MCASIALLISLAVISEDHWLGLANVWALTRSSDQTSVLRVDLWDFEGGAASAEYSHFRIGDEQAAYKLSVGTYKGTAGMFTLLKIKIRQNVSCTFMKLPFSVFY